MEGIEEIVIAGTRHSDCYDALFKLAPRLAETARDEDNVVEGFVTNSPYKKFVDRKEAYIAARINRQLSERIVRLKEEKGEKELYDEDLY